MGRLARGVRRLLRLPRRLRDAVDDRLFAAIFHVTRVTNDDYGWRPDPPGPRLRGGEEDPGVR